MLHSPEGADASARSEAADRDPESPLTSSVGPDPSLNSSASDWGAGLDEPRAGGAAGAKKKRPSRKRRSRSADAPPTDDRAGSDPNRAGSNPRSVEESRSPARAESSAAGRDEAAASSEGGGSAKKTRRRRSRGRSKAGAEAGASDSPRAHAESASDQRGAASGDATGEPDGGAPDGGADGGAEGGTRKKRRRRSKRAVGTRHTPAVDPAEHADAAEHSAPDDEPESEAGSAAVRKQRKRSRRGRKKLAGGGDPAGDESGGDAAAKAAGSGARSEDGASAPRKRRRRGSRGGRLRSGGADSDGAVAVEGIPGEEDLPYDEEDAGNEAGAARGRDAGKRGRKASAKQERASSERGSRKKRRSSHEDDEDEDERSTVRARPKPNVIVVNAADPDETRVAVIEEGEIVDFQMKVHKQQSLVNDIYRGKVVNLEPAIGAAFVDFGQGRNGFLHTSDVLSCYGDSDWNLKKLLATRLDADEWEGLDDEVEEGDADEGDDSGDGASNGKAARKTKTKTARKAKAAKSGGRFQARPRRPITELLKKGQSVVVQITKDAIGDKGPTLTTYISIPGRHLVLMPSIARTGVSRKIEDEKERRRLKRILKGLSVPDGMGVIVRTAGTGATKAELKRDLEYLLLIWDTFGKRLDLGRGPIALYEESDVAIRTMRDLFNESTEKVVVDDERVHERMVEFTEKLMPEAVERIVRHDASRPLFHTFGIEQDFERIFARRVDLASGGSVVFDQAEALVAIDVNSGKTRSDGFDFEDVALKTNLEAVPEIARQIRLRDLGGIVVIDFIDMLRAANRRTVERAFRDALSLDRARSKIGRISQFGLLEMTRQRLGAGMSKMLFTNCPRCRGTGRVRTVESRSVAILRRLGSALTLKGFSQVEIRAHPEVVDYIEQNCQEEVEALAKQHERALAFTAVPDQVEDSVLRYARTDGREVRPGGRRRR